MPDTQNDPYDALLSSLLFTDPAQQEQGKQMAAAVRGQSMQGMGLASLGAGMHSLSARQKAAGPDPLGVLGAGMAHEADQHKSDLVSAARYGNESRLLKLALGQQKVDTAAAHDATNKDIQGGHDTTKRDVAGINADARVTVGRAQAAAREAAARIMGDSKGNQNAVGGLLKFGKEFDPDSNPGLKPYRDLMFQADRLTALAKGDDGVVKDLDPSQMHEMAMGLHRIFTGANRTVQSQVNALVPHTITGDANQFVRWFTNEPTGTGQKAFVQMMQDTIDRERGVAAGALKQAQTKVLARHAPTIRSNPQDALSIIQAGRYDPDEALTHVAGLGSGPPAGSPLNVGVAPVPPPAGNPRNPLGLKLPGLE
jgi:hypothetical protein